MNTIIENIGLITGALLIGSLCGLFVLRPRKVRSVQDFEQKAEKQKNEAEERAKKIMEEAKAKAKRMKDSTMEDETVLTEQFKRIEAIIKFKEDQLEKKNQKLGEEKAIFEQEKKILDTFREKNKSARKNYIMNLSERAAQKPEDARTQLLHDLDIDLELVKENRLRKYEEYLGEDKVRIAKNMVTEVIQRYASPTSVEKKNLAVTVSRDEIKGKILGKNAENLLLLEELTGVDIIFNDSPNTIIVSCFDLVRKHIARETIQKLLKEKIITPEKIRQKLAEAKIETDRTLIHIGRETIKKLELNGRNLPADFAKIVGRLSFRTSYGQNILKHSFEVGNFTMMLGSELGLNMETCKVAGFFHDLGKAIDQEVGGSHDVLTKEIMQKFQFPEDEIHAAWAHHDAEPQRTAEAMLVKAGDAISAGRPGARQESLEKYIERIRAIETISNSYEGVSKSFAISAGREVRVMVEPAMMKDEDLEHLAKNIALEIQGNVAYPGKIKVNIIRKTLTSTHAKEKKVKTMA